MSYSDKLRHWCSSDHNFNAVLKLLSELRNADKKEDIAVKMSCLLITAFGEDCKETLTYDDFNKMLVDVIRFEGSKRKNQSLQKKMMDFCGGDNHPSHPPKLNAFLGGMVKHLTSKFFYYGKSSSKSSSAAAFACKLYVFEKLLLHLRAASHTRVSASAVLLQPAVACS